MQCQIRISRRCLMIRSRIGRLNGPGLGTHKKCHWNSWSTARYSPKRRSWQMEISAASFDLSIIESSLGQDAHIARGARIPYSSSWARSQFMRLVRAPNGTWDAVHQLWTQKAPRISPAEQPAARRGSLQGPCNRTYEAVVSLQRLHQMSSDEQPYR